MAEDKVETESIDHGTRQWTPEDELNSARIGLQRRLDTQRARRNATTARPAPSPTSAQRLQIALSYPELLSALSHAAVDQRSVILTRTEDNVYLTLADAAGSTRDSVAALTELELAVRDRLEAAVARRYLDLHGPDHLVGEADPSDDADETTERMRI